jgi:hypothetical protein
MPVYPGALQSRFFTSYCGLERKFTAMSDILSEYWGALKTPAPGFWSDPHSYFPKAWNNTPIFSMLSNGGGPMLSIRLTVFVSFAARAFSKT